MWKCNMLNIYKVCLAQSNETVVMISTLDKFQKYGASKIKQQGEHVRVQHLRLQLWQIPNSWDYSKETTKRAMNLCDNFICSETQFLS